MTTRMVIVGVLAGCLAGADRVATAALTVDLSQVYQNKKAMEQGFFSSVRGSNVYDVAHHSVVQLPHALIDNVYALPQGQLFPLELRLHKDGKDEVSLPDEVMIHVRTSPEIRLMSGNPGTLLQETVRVSDQVAEYRFKYLRSWGVVRKEGDFTYPYRGPCLLVKTDVPASEKSYPVVFWLEYGKYVSSSRRMLFKVIPRITAKQPRCFRTGFLIYGLQLLPENAREYAEFLRDCGVNALSISYRVDNGYPANAVTENLPRELKRAGIARFGELQELVDGISVGERPIPLGDALMLADGKPFTWGGARYTCPYAVYSKGTFYRKNLVPFLRRHLVVEDKSDHLMPNWEPFKFGKDYCFCRNCRREFARFARLDEAEVQNVPGDELQKKYGDLWVRFSSAAHAKLVLAIQDAMDEACAGTDKRPLFLPEINVSSMMPLLDKGRQELFSRYDARNYVRDLPGVCPWAPYNYYHANDPHIRHMAGYHLNIIRCAEFFRQYYAGTKIYFLPQGYQCTWWLSMPEAIAFETFGLFLAGMQGSFAYAFDGYDARYYAALARCNDLIAASEDFVTEAELDKSVSCPPVSPVPPLYVYRSHTRFMQQLCEGSSVLYPRTFRKGGEWNVFLGNSWSGGEIYGRLRIAGLEGGNYVVTFPGTERSCVLTAEKLAQDGVLVCVEPLDWLKACVRPARPGETPGKDVAEESLEAKLSQDRSRLQAACDATERSKPPAENEPLDEALP